MCRNTKEAKRTASSNLPRSSNEALRTAGPVQFFLGWVIAVAAWSGTSDKMMSTLRDSRRFQASKKNALPQRQWRATQARVRAHIFVGISTT